MSERTAEVQGAHSSRRLRGLTRQVCEELLATLGALLRGEAVRPASWEPFLPVLHRHRLEGLVCGRLCKSDSAHGALPEAFRRSYLANVRRSALHTEEAHRIVAAAADIPFVFVQGMALLATQDADPGERRLSDLDVLVAPRDETRFIAAMQRLGYGAKGARRFISWDYPGHWELVREAEPGLAFGLDVSSGTRLPVCLLNRHVLFEAEAILRRSCSKDDLPVPDVADLLAMCVLNVEQKDFAWLGPYLDVTALASRCRERDWRGVAAALSRDGNRGVAGAILDACRRWFSAAIPDWVVEECSTRCSLAVQGWQDFFLDPVTVCSQLAAAGRGHGPAPSLAGYVCGFGRRFMSFRSWPVRAQVLTELLTDGFAALNDFLYRARSAAGRTFARLVVNPAVVGIGWLLVHPAFLLSGAMLHWVYSRRHWSRLRGNR
jgi:hypothetical protein